MAESENSYEIQNEQKSDISGGLGTVYRINNSWSWVNLHYRNEDWKLLIRELNIILSNLAPFIMQMEKDGTVDEKPEHKKAVELRSNVFKEYTLALKRDKTGKTNLVLTENLIKFVNEYDSYLRAISMKYGLYASMGDDYSNQPLLSREPRWNKKRF